MSSFIIGLTVLVIIIGLITAAIVFMVIEWIAEVIRGK